MPEKKSDIWWLPPFPVGDVYMDRKDIQDFLFRDFILSIHVSSGGA
jgi:hypothetical protein